MATLFGVCCLNFFQHFLYTLRVSLVKVVLFEKNYRTKPFLFLVNSFNQNFFSVFYLLLIEILKFVLRSDFGLYIFSLVHKSGIFDHKSGDGKKTPSPDNYSLWSWTCNANLLNHSFFKRPGLHLIVYWLDYRS